MSYYDDPENVKQYMEMCAGYDGNNIYQLLLQHLPKLASVLELGSGGALDIEFLKKHYDVTGSDLSDAFLDICQKKHPEVPFLKLDAQKLNLNQAFDCIYSNKVLHHLTPDALRASLKQQASALNPNGLIAHSFWLGDKSEEMHGLLFTYYNQETLLGIISESFEILTTLSYQEFEEDDSLFVIARLNA